MIFASAASPWAAAKEEKQMKVNEFLNEVLAAAKAALTRRKCYYHGGDA